jgi:hypothetical protein
MARPSIGFSEPLAKERIGRKGRATGGAGREVAVYHPGCEGIFINHRREERAMVASKKGSFEISKEAADFFDTNPEYQRLIRARIEEYAQKLRWMDEVTANSAMTEELAIEFGRKARRGIHRRISGQ